MTNPGGKRCVVLGGSGYIGATVSKILSDAGATVRFTYNQNKYQAEAIMRKMPNCRGYPLDLLVCKNIRNTLSQMIDDMGGLDALIHCAGLQNVSQGFSDINPECSDIFLSCDEAGWDNSISLHAKSAFIACQAAAERMRTNGGGNIVLVGALNALKPVAAPVHIASGKGALKTMVETLAKTLGDYSIRINLVAPGVLEGGINRSLSDDIKKEYLKHCSLGRLGADRDIAEWISWLVFENTYMTGQTILLDGGL